MRETIETIVGAKRCETAETAATAVNAVNAVHQNRTSNMRKLIQALALGAALAAVPACAALKAPAFENPVSAAQTADQKAYALLASYAAVLEEATDVVRDPSTPPAFKQTLVRAERIATPAAETLRIALVGYLRARADYAALPDDASRAERAAATLAIAAVRLQEAYGAARGPLADFSALINKKS